MSTLLARLSSNVFQAEQADGTIFILTHLF